MTDYTKLVKELRGCKYIDYCNDCPRMAANGYVEICNIKDDAAAAIEALQAQLPKRGEWEKEETGKGIFKQIIYKCSICGRYLDFDGVNAGRGDANYCPCCGAKMEVQE